jgi:hypothetical protein
LDTFNCACRTISQNIEDLNISSLQETVLYWQHAIAALEVNLKLTATAHFLYTPYVNIKIEYDQRVGAFLQAPHNLNAFRIFQTMYKMALLIHQINRYYNSKNHKKDLTILAYR